MSLAERTQSWRQKTGGLLAQLGGSRLAKLPRFTLEAALVALIAYSASSIFLAAITPPHQAIAPQRLAPQNIIASSDQKLLAEKVFFKALDGSNSATPAEINAQVKLFGTRPLGNGRGSAIIAINGGAQQPVSTGDRLKNGVKITGVFADRIEVIANDETGSVYLFTAQQRRQRQLLERAPFDESMLSALDVQFSDSGITIGSNGTPALLQAAGLLSGDTIAAINGRPVRSRALLIDAVTRAQDSPSITLDIMRDATLLTRSFEMAALRTLLGSE